MLRCDHVGEARGGTIACENSVSPRSVVSARLVKVEGQQCRLLLRAGAKAFLQRDPNAAVDVSTTSKREAFVRSRPNEVVSERERLSVRRDDELTKGNPALAIAGVRNLVMEYFAEQVEREVRADDRGVAQEHAVRWVERVDPYSEEAFDRLRQARESVSVLGCEDELSDKEGDPARALDERSHLSH